MHLMGSGTTARLVSAVRGLPSLSKSQQQFITAKEGYSREISARVKIREKVPRVFHSRFILVGSFESLQRNISISSVPSLNRPLRSKIKQNTNINGTNGLISHVNYLQKHPLSQSELQEYRGKTSFLYNNKTSLNHCQSKAAIFMLLD